MELFVPALPPIDPAHFRSATLPNLDIVNAATGVRTSAWGAAFWQALSNNPFNVGAVSAIRTFQANSGVPITWVCIIQWAK
jgi:hypothetical protein